MKYHQIKYDGMAIAVAWPETFGKQTGSWYDSPMRWLGINRNYYYRAGHAAIILIKNSERICHYFDFGRYHAPFQFGRVRDSSTDPDLSLAIKTVVSEGKIINIRELLQPLQECPSFHGGGTLHAAYCPVNFETAYATAKEMQKQGSIPFGPFRIDGMNCCRFVRAILLAGKPPVRHRLRLLFLWLFTPVPLGNINCLSNKTIIPKTELKPNSGTKGKPGDSYNKYNVRGTLPEPAKPKNIPSGSQWLSGEGAGSWLHLEPNIEGYSVTRYSPDGTPEFIGKFNLGGGGDFNFNKPFRYTYPSHGTLVTVIQGNIRFEFLKRI